MWVWVWVSVCVRAREHACETAHMQVIRMRAIKGGSILLRVALCIRSFIVRPSSSISVAASRHGSGIMSG